MRYLLGIVLVLALGMMPLLGCSESGDATRTVGAEFPEIDTLVSTINRDDGFWRQWRSEEYTFGVADLTVSHRWLQDSDPPISLGPATHEAMDQLVMVVQSASHRVDEDCRDIAVDGLPYSPKLDIRRVPLFIEESLFHGAKWVVSEPNDEPLWSHMRLNVRAFMKALSFSESMSSRINVRSELPIACFMFRSQRFSG